AIGVLRHAWAMAGSLHVHVNELVLLYGALAQLRRAALGPNVNAVLEAVVAAAKRAAARHDVEEPHRVDEEARRRRFEPATLKLLGSAFHIAAARAMSRVRGEDVVSALLANASGAAWAVLRGAGVDPATLGPPS